MIKQNKHIRKIALEILSLHSSILGYQNLEEGNWGRAIFYFNRAIEGDKNQNGLIGDIGIAFEKMGLPDTALNCTREYLSSDIHIENRDTAIFNMAITLEQSGLPQESIQILLNLLKEDVTQNTKSEIYYSIGVCYLRLDKSENALKYFDRCLQQNSEHLKSLMNKALILIYNNNQKDSFEAYLIHQKCIGIAPDYVDIYRNMYTNCLQIGKPIEAIKCMNTCIQLDIENKSRYYTKIAQAYIMLNDITNAAVYYKLSGYDILNIIVGMNEKLCSKLLFIFLNIQDDDSYFHSILRRYNVRLVKNGELYNKYKKIFIKALYITRLLTLDRNEANGVAHYTKREVAEKLIFDYSPFRLSLANRGNDKNEGRVIFDYFNLNKEEDVKNDIYIACFNFNKDKLNHFRLYGKDPNTNYKDASGVSLVFRDTFFSNDYHLIHFISSSSSFIDYKEKLSLFRCLYIDRNSKRVISVGYQEEESFYLENPNGNYAGYKRNIDNILSQVKEHIDFLKELIEDNSLNQDVIVDLLFSLKCLMKDSSFKEEQECRIIKVLDSDNSTDFINYLYTGYHLEEVIFGTNALKYNEFKREISSRKIQCICSMSKHSIV